MNKKTLKDMNLNSKRVIVRCDFNVPMNENREITDDRRISSSLPTIKYLLENNAKIILLSHLGRPKGKANKEFSLDKVAIKLSELLNKEVKFLQSDNVYDENVKENVLAMNDGDIVLLENTRFRAEEEKNEDNFAKDLASLGEIYINDAFGTSHRAHASNVGIASVLPSAVGFLVEKELDIIGNALANPERPFVAILGGAKVSDKIGVINNLLDVVDSIIVGGGMAYTFLKAQGYEIGTSLLEEDKIELAKELLNKAKDKNVNLYLPIDIVIAKEFKNDTEIKTVDFDKIPEDWMGLDCGEKTTEKIAGILNEAKTIIWNGPMGVFEMENFKKGTDGVAKAMAESNAVTIVGGGDSASSVEIAGYADKMTHISTGGGASLELLEGKILPGIDSIDNK